MGGDIWELEATQRSVRGKRSGRGENPPTDEEWERRVECLHVKHLASAVVRPAGSGEGQQCEHVPGDQQQRLAACYNRRTSYEYI